jgi:hypothetical protein
MFTSGIKDFRTDMFPVLFSLLSIWEGERSIGDKSTMVKINVLMETCTGAMTEKNYLMLTKSPSPAMRTVSSKAFCLCLYPVFGTLVSSSYYTLKTPG